MRVGLGWVGTPPAGSDDLVLTFSPAAAEAAEAAGARVQRADELLAWDERARIEDETSAVVARCGDAPAFAAARYTLQAEVSNLLRAHVVAGALAASGRAGAAVTADAACPASVLLGAQAGLGQAPSPPAAWRALESPMLPRGARDRMAGLVARGLGAARSSRRARVAIVPSMKAGAAIARADRNRLRDAGVALCLFPGIDLGGAARIGLRTGLPVVAARGPAAAPEPALDLPDLHDDPRLAAALARVAERVLADAAELAGHAAATLRGWERALPALRAVVLPTAASGAARLVLPWARERGLATAVVQHGIYGFREVWGVDNDVDALLAWGPGVADQVAEWPVPRPAVSVIGAGDLSHVDLPPSRELRRVLMTTTNRPTGSALGLYDFQDAFVQDVAAGLRRLAATGVEIVLRPHPSEPVEPYETSAARLALPLTVAPPGPFAEALAQADLVVSSVSSVAFEAAALGRPVLLWNARIPPEIRARRLLAPFDRPARGMFDDAPQFDALAAQGPDALREAGSELAGELRRYAQPFDPDAFAEALERLGGS